MPPRILTLVILQYRTIMKTTVESRLLFVPRLLLCVVMKQEKQAVNNSLAMVPSSFLSESIRTYTIKN